MRKEQLTQALFNKPPKVRFKTLREELMKPAPIGHLLAIKVFENGEYRDVLFADHFDATGNRTIIYYNKDLAEHYPVEMEAYWIENGVTTVFYKNNTHFEITRIA